MIGVSALDALTQRRLRNRSRTLLLSGAECTVQLGHEEPRVNRLVKEAGLGRQIAPIWIDTPRYHKDRRRRPLDVCPPRKVISIECTGHFHVRDDGVDFCIANACDAFVGRASFQNLESCVPKGIACEPSDSRVILDEEYARRVILSTHVATIAGPRGGSLARPRYVCFVSQRLSIESHFDLLLPLFLRHPSG